MVDVARGQNGVTNLAVPAAGEQTVTFSAAYPDAVTVNVTVGGPVTVELSGQRVGTVAAGETRPFDARGAGQPLRVRMQTTTAATVNVTGTVGGRNLSDPIPAPTGGSGGAADPALTARIVTLEGLVATLQARQPVVVDNAAAVPAGTPADTIVIIRPA